MRLSKHYKILNDNINIKFNTINYKENKSIYITFKTWLTPTDDNVTNYIKYTRTLKHNLRMAILNEFNGNIFTNNQIIFDFSFHADRMMYNKPTFLNISITLYPLKHNESFNYLYEESLTKINTLSNIIINTSPFVVNKNKMIKK